MSSETELELTKEQWNKLEEKDITEDEVSDCISEKMDEGYDHEQAIAACLDMAESGSTKPENSNSINKGKIDSLQENKDSLQTGKFAVKGSTVTVKETDDNLLLENVPVQALGQDRDGDKITAEGQKQIVEQLQSGEVPAFPNHGIGDYDAIYDFRDIMGQWVDGMHEDGMTYGTLRLRKNNEAAEHLKDLLSQDMPVGFSVGFIPKEFDKEKSQETNGEAITDLDLMEISPVGIPSKPEAVNELEDKPVAMAKSIMKEQKGASNPEQFSKRFTKELKNAMTDKNGQSEKDKSQVQNKDGKSEEQKQVDSGDVEAMMEVVGSKINEHLAMAMDEAEDEIMDMIDADEENEEETDEMDDEEETDGEYGDDEDDEEMSQESSDHTEESEKSSSESADDESENKDVSEEKDGLDESEKTLEDEEGKNTINSVEEKDQESENQETEKSGEKINDPFVITEDSKA